MKAILQKTLYLLLLLNFGSKYTTLKILLALTFLIFCNNINGQNFFQVVRDGQYEKVEKLINENPCWVDSTSMGYSPLMFASNFGHEKVVDLLIKRGADMFKVDSKSGRTALHFAIIRNNLSVVNVFIGNGMDLNVKDGNKKTALFYAIENNNKELVDLLLKKNAKLPEEKELMDQVIHPSVLNCYDDIAEKLVQNGASLSSTDNKGRSLLHNAVIGKNIKWIDYLIAKHLDIN